MMKRRFVIVTSVLVVAALIILSFRLLDRKTPEFKFDTVKVSRGRLTSIVTATGTIQAITTINVGTQVSGIIKHIYVDFNDKVKKGQVLARLDETALKAQVDQSQAAVDQAHAQYEYQKATFDRLKALFDKNLIAQADYDQALYNYENSKGTLSSAQSALDRAKVNLAYATIYSPIDGVVLNRAVEEGQTVASSFNTPTLFTIANDLTRMEVQTSVDEADIGKVKQGQKVDFTVDAYPDIKFDAVVTQVRLQPVTTNNVVTYTVILNAPNPGKKLMPGMTASASIYVADKPDALIVSGKAMRFRPDQSYINKVMAKNPQHTGGRNFNQAQAPGREAGNSASGGNNAGSGLQRPIQNLAESPKFVWVEKDSTTIHRVRVKVGIDNGTNVEILSGLTEGEKVVISMTDAKARPQKPVITTRRRPLIL
jgi:HlyD family secretion protein